MITCTKDSLVFDFQNFATALQSCAAPYIAEWLPRITGIEPKEVVEGLIQKRPWLHESRKAKLRAKAAAITREQIAQEFTQTVSRKARCSTRLEISFIRTLRLPDDGKVYPLPPGLSSFPLRQIERYANDVSAEWLRRGGVLMPMYQAEAMWLYFSGFFPCAIKVATGLINAVNGQPWTPGLTRSPQSYVVRPEQPWLDGYCAGPGIIRQFVAAPLGKGYTAEEQLSGSNHGGVQLEIFSLKPERYFQKEISDQLPRTPEDVLTSMLYLDDVSIACSSEMGLGAGGSMKQQVYKDPWEADDWDLTSSKRVWVHLCDALRWHQITGELPPQKPITAKDYTDAGLPWFDYYRDDMVAIEGSPVLAQLKSVFAMAKENDDESIPQEDSVEIANVSAIGPDASRNTVSGWDGI